ncbi:MAG: hypothetical protein EU531_11445, partial [Promethearchaeota archaeon]
MKPIPSYGTTKFDLNHRFKIYDEAGLSIWEEQQNNVFEGMLEKKVELIDEDAPTDIKFKTEDLTYKVKNSKGQYEQYKAKA